MEIFQMSISASVLIILMIAVRPAVKNKVSGNVLMLVWGIICCKLMMPDGLLRPIEKMGRMARARGGGGGADQKGGISHQDSCAHAARRFRRKPSQSSGPDRGGPAGAGGAPAEGGSAEPTQRRPAGRHRPQRRSRPTGRHRQE